MKNWDFQKDSMETHHPCWGATVRRLSFEGLPPDADDCSQKLSDEWRPMSGVVLHMLSVSRAASIVFESSSALKKGGHFILRQDMWEFSLIRLPENDELIERSLTEE